MHKVTFGKNAKLTAHSSDRNKIQEFYGNVLGCSFEAMSDRDIIQLGPQLQMGIVYANDALSTDNAFKAIWLELRTADPDKLKDEILAFGINEIDYPDHDNFYFQAPGGQVFRIVEMNEE